MSEFDLLPWQSELWANTVRRHRKAGLPHALLVSGPGGVGKHALCLHLARWLLCQQPGDDACGQCHSCQLWAAGSHPDFMICQPEENSRQIRIDNVRRVNELIFQTPQISQAQVVVIRPAEVMNTNAANALLKTLEEPPGESFILLETERFGSVLPTIRSRCQRITVGLPPRDISAQWLQSQGVSADAAADALQCNGGAPLRAQHWLNSDEAKAQTQWTEQLLSWTFGRASLSQTADPWVKLEFQNVVAWFYQLSCDLVKANAGAPSHSLQYADAVTELFAVVDVDQRMLIGFHEKLQEILGQLLSGVSHHNKALTIEVLLLEWQKLIRVRAGASA